VNSPKFSLIVHGGAWDIPAAAIPDCHVGIRRALEAGREILARGGAAMDAVEAAIIVLEDDVTFDAGTGAHLNRDGRVQLDAIIMDGASLKAGAVAAVERIKNPIRLARKILESSEHMMLAGAGAELFAQENGIALCDPSELVIDRERLAALPGRESLFRISLRSQARHGRRCCARYARANRRGHLYRRDVLQISGTRGRFAPHRVRLLRRCGSGRYLMHRPR
jgi:isoaspartyl peptidase/L-asparaginase-like protein (Ntn-hydrolase superfamily)